MGTVPYAWSQEMHSMRVEHVEIYCHLEVVVRFGLVVVAVGAMHGLGFAATCGVVPASVFSSTPLSGVQGEDAIPS